MLSFRSYFEGQALRVSSDMERFAQEAIGILNKHQWQYGQPAIEREVDSERYGKRIVKVIPAERPEGSGGMGNADYESGEINIFVKPGWKMGEGFVDFIVHELVHMFDPKLNNPKLASSKWGIDAWAKAGKPLSSTGEEENDKVYHTSPWEQDAFMAQAAREAIRLKREFWGNDRKTIQATLAKYKPETAWEWDFAQNPKMWRKYLNTLYQELQRRMPH
jgi:hypothetical protein